LCTCFHPSQAAPKSTKLKSQIQETKTTRLLLLAYFVTLPIPYDTFAAQIGLPLRGLLCEYFLRPTIASFFRSSASCLCCPPCAAGSFGWRGCPSIRFPSWDRRSRMKRSAPCVRDFRIPLCRHRPICVDGRTPVHLPVRLSGRIPWCRR